MGTEASPAAKAAALTHDPTPLTETSRHSAAHTRRIRTRDQKSEIDIAKAVRSDGSGDHHLAVEYSGIGQVQGESIERELARRARGRIRRSAIVDRSSGSRIVVLAPEGQCASITRNPVVRRGRVVGSERIERRIRCAAPERATAAADEGVNPVSVAAAGALGNQHRVRSRHYRRPIVDVERAGRILKHRVYRRTPLDAVQWLRGIGGDSAMLWIVAVTAPGRRERLGHKRTGRCKQNSGSANAHIGIAHCTTNRFLL